MHDIYLEPLISNALKEDWGGCDWSTMGAVEADTTASARIIAKEPIIIAGSAVAAAVFRRVDPALVVNLAKGDGMALAKGDLIMTIAGAARSILMAERVALNFLARLSGIASLAHKFVKELEGTKTQLLDTRKTTPGLRHLEKMAASAVGARNHRFGLYDGVMLKENHIRAAGGITAAMHRVRGRVPPTLRIEVETTSLAEVKEALAAGADIIMLDNMPLEMMREAVRLVGGGALLEASGNVRLETVRQVALTGVDFVSTSAFITAARWADLSLLFDIV